LKAATDEGGSDALSFVLCEHRERAEDLHRHESSRGVHEAATEHYVSHDPALNLGDEGQGVRIVLAQRTYQASHDVAVGAEGVLVYRRHGVVVVGLFEANIHAEAR
jgi:hypothetical protein